MTPVSSRAKLAVAILAVVALLLCCGAVAACTPVGNVVGVHHDSSHKAKKSNKSKKKCTKKRNGRCVRWSATTA